MSKLTKCRSVNKSLSSKLIKLTLLCLLPALTSQSLLAQNFSENFDSLDDKTWTRVDRGDLSCSDGVLSLRECYIHAGDTSWDNYLMEFKARAPESAEEVRIFANFRYNDDKSRYIFGLRGGNNNDLFLSRIGADNNTLLLAIEPLDFIPQKGEWYTIKLQIDESSIQVFLNDEKDARLKAVDAGSPFTTGSIALGGGWSTVEYDYVKVSPLEGYKISEHAAKYNFQDAASPAINGWTVVDSSKYSKEKGIGWREDGLFVRQRNNSKDPLFDTLVGFKETGSKILLVDLPDGDYIVSLHLGDPSYRSKNRVFFMDELQPSINSISETGGSTVLRKSITTYNGQLRMRFEIDQKGIGSSMNWMTIEKRADAGEEAWKNYLTAKDNKQEKEKEALRQKQRSKYSGISIKDIQNSRTEYSLNGNWLFQPDYEVKKEQSPWEEANDDAWHVMNVPDFWTPVFNWTYVNHNIARGSKNWIELEEARCDAFTFDYQKAKTGYYKQYIHLPADISGKTIQLHFEAIAKSSKIWVNGILATTHEGMFAPIDTDITSLVKPGDNFIVVQAGDSARFESDDNTIQGVAVSVEVTRKMLESMPHGMYKGLNRGIWQDVSLIISDPVTIEDTFFKPLTNHFDMDVRTKNRSDKTVEYSIAAQIREHGSNELVYDHHSSSRTGSISTNGQQESHNVLSSAELKHADFKTWSPEFPNLYTADVFLYNYNKDSSVNLKSFHKGAVKLNFQPMMADKAPNWTATDGSPYDAKRGYGWSEALNTSKQNTSKDELFDTAVSPNPGREAVFTYDIENGEYLLTLQFGNPAEASLAEAYIGNKVNSIEKAIVRDFKKAGESLTVIKSVAVQNGKLEITVPALPAEGEQTYLNYLVIEKRNDVSEKKWKLGQNHFNVLDNVSYNAGFRTFVVSGDEFYLNGHPYKMRGANHNPNILKPNDKELANWFMKNIHDNNINFTRSHGGPMNDIWLDAADEQGVAISQEGIWPWLFLHGKYIPHPSLIDIWEREWIALINKHKNHPSLLLWTMNNEMKIYITNNEGPWRVLSDAIKAVRTADPTRPVVADSGYCRHYLKSQGGLPEGVDDGDVDDYHYYPNWYNKNTFFGIRDGKSFADRKTPGRPYISQEFSTGYLDADTGHAIKHYIYTHMTPQAQMGRRSYEHMNPKYFQERHAMYSKESCEAVRTEYRDTSAGIQIFALMTWYQNNYDVETINPYPTLEAVSQAWEPIMVSAQLMGRHFYAGSEHTIKSVVVNDSPIRETLTDITVDWDIVYNDKTLKSGSKKYSGSLKYFNNKHEKLTLKMPDTLPEAKVEAKIIFKLSANDRYISSNTYDICIADDNFIPAGTVRIGHYSQNDELSGIIAKTGAKIIPLTDLKQLDKNAYDVLLVSNISETPEGYENILKYAEEGGQVLLSRNNDSALKLFPDELRGSTTLPKEIATPCAYEKSIFDGIEPDELAWFTGTENSEYTSKKGFVPISLTRAYNVNYIDHVTPLVETLLIHGYVNKSIENGYFPRMTFDEVFGYPLLEIEKGEGRVIISSMYLHTKEDPIANRLLANIINYLNTDSDVSSSLAGEIKRLR